MLDDAQDFSPEDLLERQMTEAYLEQDYAVVQDMLRQKDVPDALKERMLSTAVRDGNLPIVRCAVEEAGTPLTDVRSIMLVFLACQAQKLDIVLYLSEKTAELGLQRSDAYELIFERFPEEKHDIVAEELLSRASDKQDALNKMLYAAAAAKAFGVIPKLLDMGADPNPNGGTDIYLLLANYDHDFFRDRQRYTGLMEKCLDKFDDLSVLDVALTVAAFKIPDDTQYPETIHMMLKKGADPFASHGEAETHICTMLNSLNRFDEARGWHDTFTAARHAETAEARRQFELLFKQDFRVADLRQTVNADGDTGFTLAARARLLDKVVEAARREGNAPLSASDITSKNNRNQSALSMSVDRDDMGALLDPAYWAKADAGILRKVEENLDKDHKPFVDMARLASAMDQYALKQKAARFKLKPS